VLFTCVSAIVCCVWAYYYLCMGCCRVCVCVCYDHVMSSHDCNNGERHVGWGGVSCYLRLCVVMTVIYCVVMMCVLCLCSSF
jgi:hypothetical protein